MHKLAHLFQMFQFIQYITVQLHVNCKMMTVALTLTVLHKSKILIFMYDL